MQNAGGEDAKCKMQNDKCYIKNAKWKMLSAK